MYGQECNADAGRTVDSNANDIADLLDLAASETSRAQIPEDEMVVRAICLELVPVLHELFCHRLGVCDHLPGIGLPGRRASLLESGGDTCDRLKQG